MDVLSVLFIPPILFIGLVTSYEDFKLGKIRNKWILFGLYYGLAVYLLLLVWNFVAEPVTYFYYDHFTGINPENGYVFTVNYLYFIKVIYNSILALFIGFALWKFGKFSAGDAKLFFVFAFLLPLSFYWQSYFSLFPSFVLLINIFVFVLLYIIGESLYGLAKEVYYHEKKSNLFRCLNAEQLRVWSFKFVKNVFGFLLIVLSISSIMLFFTIIDRPLREQFGFGVRPWQPYVLALFVFLLLVTGGRMRNFLKRHELGVILTFVLLSGLGYWILGDEVLVTLRHIFLIMLVVEISLILLLRRILQYHNDKRCARYVSPDKLRSRMALMPFAAEYIMEKDMNFFYQFKQAGPKDFHFLNRQKIGLLQDWCKEQKIDKVAICKQFPFAVWIFLGVLFTLLYQGAVIQLVLRALASGLE